MIATEAFLGVRPAKQYKFIVIASPAGNYFKSGSPAVSILVSQYTRAAPGGTGAAKCGGNYAASLVPQAEAMAQGHDQVVFLDAAERKWIEELGGMNLYFAFEDGSLITPPLSGTILPGITRDSILTLAREEGLNVREERYSIDQWRADAASGKLLETFACGTAAVVTPSARCRIGQQLHHRHRRPGPDHGQAEGPSGRHPARLGARHPWLGRQADLMHEARGGPLPRFHL
jgi:branched-chain amino acid aminotransferase